MPYLVVWHVIIRHRCTCALVLLPPRMLVIGLKSRSGRPAPTLLCKANTMCLLSCKVSRHCLLALHGIKLASYPTWQNIMSRNRQGKWLFLHSGLLSDYTWEEVGHPGCVVLTRSTGSYLLKDGTTALTLAIIQLTLNQCYILDGRQRSALFNQRFVHVGL